MTRFLCVLGVTALAIGCGPVRPTTKDSGVGGGGVIGTAGSGGAGGTAGSGGTAGTGGTAGSGGTAGAGGTAGSGGGSSDGGFRTLTIEQAKNATFCSDLVRIEGAVVVAVDRTDVSAQDGGVRTWFWVADPNAPQHGLYIKKWYDDLPYGFVPAIGDRVNLEGVIFQEAIRPTAGPLQIARRRYMGNQFRCNGITGSGQLLTVTKTGTATVPVPYEVTAPFGVASDGGWAPNRELQHARVRVPGPLSLTEAKPEQLINLINGVPAGYRVAHMSNGTTFLINDNKPELRDAGPSGDGGCWFGPRADAGSIVTFPNGVIGMWDTFAWTGNDGGFLPGTDALWGYVLYPQSCDDLQGQVQ